MIPGWYLRMNRRERTLAGIIAGILFLLVNLTVWSGLIGAVQKAHTELAARRATRNEQNVYLKELPMWQKRDAWLKQHQPTLKSAGESSTLLDRTKQIASKHNVLIENPTIGTGDSTPDHQAVFATVDTKSPWPPLVHFLYDMQTPEEFVVFENVSLAIDSADPTMMRGKFKIARWFAPAGKGTK